MTNLVSCNKIPVTKAENIKGNNLIWKVVFEGPEATPYEYRLFTIKFIYFSRK